MGLLSLLGGGKNPAKSAMPYLEKAATVGPQYYNPYIEQGQKAGEIAGNQYQQMTQNPTGLYDEILAHYTPSKGLQYKLSEAQKAAHNAAAAGGYAGGNRDIADRTQLINDILSGGQDEYVRSILGILGTGLQGQENALTRGFGASGNLASDLSNIYGTQGNLAYQGQAEQNKSKQQLMNLIAQALGTAGGFAIGGPAGAYAGSQIGRNSGGGGISEGMYSGMNARQLGIGKGLFGI